MSTHANTEQASDGRPKVLIVDDEPMIRELVNATRKTDDRYELITASDGLEGVEIAQHIQPDLIILDVRMPRMTGLEA